MTPNETAWKLLKDVGSDLPSNPNALMMFTCDEIKAGLFELGEVGLSHYTRQQVTEHATVLMRGEGYNLQTLARFLRNYKP